MVTAPQPALRFSLGQRIRVRDRIWEIEATEDAGDAQVLTLRDLQDPQTMLQVLSAVERIEIQPSAELAQNLTPYSEWKIFHDAIAISMKPAPGVLAGFDQANIRTEDYQLVPVIRAFRRPRQRIIIADDVGLGKTIEAALILIELRARRRADRVLVVCPAGLQDQWADELKDKVGLDFDVFDKKKVAETRQQIRLGENPWKARRRILTSVDYVKRPDTRRLLRDITWDLVIVDEAHYLSETSSGGRAYRTERSRFGQFIARQADSLILLTATPHTGDPRSFFSLVNLVDDKLVPTPEKMSRDRTAPVLVRRYKKDIKNPDGSDRFKDLLIQTVPVKFASDEERKLYESVHAYTERRFKRAGRDSAVGFAMTVIKKRLISSRAALVATLRNRTSSLEKNPVDVDPRRGVLADYRAGAPLSEEQQAEAERRVVGAPPIDEADRSQETRQLARLIKQAEAIAEPDAKAVMLCEKLLELTSGAVTGKREKVIVFTEFLDTHAYLLAFLRENGLEGKIASLTGGATREERAAAINSFNSDAIDVLLATDAASEGLNLQQRCRMIMHYELPWNPNRLEQRNGRVYRWGQKEDVFAWNLSLEETYDAHILNVLLTKTEQIRRDLGSASDVIGVMSALAWDDILMRSRGIKTPGNKKAQDEIADIEREIEKRTEAARIAVQAWESREFGERPIFDARAEKEVIEEKAASAARRLSGSRRQDLVEFVLSRLGGSSKRGEDGLFTISVPQSLQRGVPPEISAAAYEHERVPEGRRGIDLLGTQHPLLQAIAAVARAALYDGTSPLAGLRLSAKVSADGRPGVIYTFATRYGLGDGSTYAEEIIPVFVPDGRPPSADETTDNALLAAPEAAGAAEPHLLDRLRTSALIGRLKEAEEEGYRRSRLHASAYEASEQARANALLRDLELWSNGRRTWLEQQLSLPPGQMQLVLDDTAAAEQREEQELARRQRRRFEDELRLLDESVKSRREEIERRGTVSPPERLQLVGALLVVPKR